MSIRIYDLVSDEEEHIKIDAKHRIKVIKKVYWGATAKSRRASKVYVPEFHGPFYKSLITKWYEYKEINGYMDETGEHSFQRTYTFSDFDKAMGFINSKIKAKLRRQAKYNIS